MLNWNFFSPRNFIVIGLIALIFTILFTRFTRAVSNGAK